MSTEGPMRVIYSVEADDLFQYYKNFLFRTPTGRLLMLLSYLLAYLAVVAILRSTGKEATRLFDPKLAAVVAVVYLPTFWLLLRRQAKSIFKQRRALHGTRVLEIAPTGLSSSGEIDQGTLGWAAINRVVGTRQHILLYIDKQNAAIVPRRAFPSLEASEAFLHAAKAWQAAAMPNTKV